MFHTLILYILVFFFQNKLSFSKTIRLSNSLASDQDGHFIWPNLGPYGFLRISADVKCSNKRGKDKWTFWLDKSLNSLPPGYFFMLFMLSADFFFKINFLRNSFRNTTRVSNSLDPDQARHYVGPDLVPKCLQKLSADDTRRQRVNPYSTNIFVLKLTFAFHVSRIFSNALQSTFYHGSKHYESWSDCSKRSSLTWVHNICNLSYQSL